MNSASRNETGAMMSESETTDKSGMTDEAKYVNPPRSWDALHVTAHAAACEAIEYALMETGARGTETREVGGDVRVALVQIIAYYDDAPALDDVREEIALALRIYACDSNAVLHIETSTEPARDWLAEWKRNWQPVTVADTFIIAPPWSEVHPTHNTHVIRIEPGMAFGTGTHETTRLCLQSIATLARGQQDIASVLDVGTGTGILAIAAAMSFPFARIEACDTDAVAVAIARENARLNRVGERIVFSANAIDDATLSADLVIANLTADVILPLLPLLVRLTCGRLVLSGILDVQAETVREGLREQGVTQIETLADGEWVALIA
jgi:ribosomal protein L11 methyltransferase